MNRKNSVAAVALGALMIVTSTGPVRAQDASIGIRPAHIYPPIESANADIRSALATAKHEHKHVILDFGGDWCPDCQVLNIYFNQDANAELVAHNFIRVNVNVGRIDANKDIAERYGVQLTAVPALAVIDGHGKVVYAQGKEFSDMRHLSSAALTDFLRQWRP